MAGDLLFGRRARLLIAPKGSTTATEIVSGHDDGRGSLRIVFKIKKTDKKDPNTSEISVYNLSADTRSAVQQRGTRLQLEAGYEQTGLSRIFVGTVRTCDHIRQGSLWQTKFQVGDGESELRNARATESFDADTQWGDIAKFLANQSGLALGNTNDFADSVDKTFHQGYAVYGAVSRSLDRLCRSIGVTWSVQDGALLFLNPGQVAKVPIPELTPETGLIGSPEMGTPAKKGKPAPLKLKALIQPAQIGGKVKVKCDRYDGYVRIKQAVFDGDTHGGAWYTDMEATVL